MSRPLNPVLPKKTLIHAGWLIDGQGNAPLADQWITIQGGRIAKIASAPKGVPLPKEALDFSHATILPALMDAHVHLALSGTTDAAARSAQLENDPEQTRQLIEQHLYAHNQCGIAAVRDAGDRQAMVLAFKKHSAQPRLAATCWAWHRPGRYGGMIGRTLTRDTIQKAPFTKALKGADHIKLIQSGLNSLDGYGRQTAPQFTADQLAVIARRANQLKLPVMVHANGEVPVTMAIQAGCRSIEHGYFMGRDNLMRMADQQIVWVPTTIPMAVLTRPKLVTAAQADVARKTLDHQLAQIDFARHQGVPIALGTDAGAIGVCHGAAVIEEIGYYIAAGMALPEAIQCATLNNAALMGLEKQGALRQDWSADMIAVPGPPDDVPESLHRIERVWIHS